MRTTSTNFLLALLAAAAYATPLSSDEDRALNQQFVDFMAAMNSSYANMDEMKMR